MVSRSDLPGLVSSTTPAKAVLFWFISHIGVGFVLVDLTLAHSSSVRERRITAAISAMAVNNPLISLFYVLALSLEMAEMRRAASCSPTLSSNSPLKALCLYKYIPGEFAL